MINKYPGKCSCGVAVAAGDGEAYRANDGRWAVRCAGCQDAPEALSAASGSVTAAERSTPVAASQGDGYTLLSGHPASPYQAAVFDHMRYGTGSIIIKAGAGSGKTTTFKNGLRYLPEKAHVQLFAFGRDPAGQLKAAVGELEALGERSYRNVRAGTFHSVCMGAVRKHLNLPDAQVKVEDDKCRKILKGRLGDTSEGQEAYAQYAPFVTALVGFAKGEGIGCLVPDTEERWWNLVEHHDLHLESTEADPARGVAMARQLLGWSNEAAATGWLDFDDQLYCVVLWKLRLWQNDVVMIDECFVPDTPILVGEQKTIQELCESEYDGPIVTWSSEKGTHLSRVIGSKRNFVGKPMVRVRTRQLSTARNHPGQFKGTAKIRTLICTEDHKIWTSTGWITAKELTAGMIVKHETIAPVVRSYQSTYAHTAAGHDSLSKTADWKRFGGYTPPRGSFVNRGGNGRPLPKHERLMLERLGDSWKSNYIIKTGLKRKNLHRLPTSYKLDIVNLEMQVVIEVDGQSHKDPIRQAQDERKDSWLRSNGWKVIRIQNRDVLRLTDDELRRMLPACPVDAGVISVESWVNRKHKYVYDLSVEDTHCYFAHGLLVHNCQDTSAIRRAIARLALKPSGRLYAVGDEKQAIFGFAGASVDAMDLVARDFGCRELPLMVSYRCARRIVERAQTWMPELEAAPNAPEGEVIDDLPLAETLTRLTAKDAILCRQTAPLVSVAYGLIARGRACQILGKEIGEGLVNLVQAQRARGIDRLVKKLETWCDREMARFIAKGNERRAEAVKDRVDCLLVIIEALPETSRTIPALIAKISSMFSDDKDAGVLTLATVHKVKGLEYPTVAILRPELMPSRAARLDWQYEQECNLMGVAATRAKSSLIYVREEDMQIEMVK